MIGKEIAAVKNHISELVHDKENEVLDHAGKYALRGGGKLLRPALVSLMAHATMSKADSDRYRAMAEVPTMWDEKDQMCRFLRLAEVTELIHTASLVHDDVIDNSDTRRGQPALHTRIGAKRAVLAGDFLLARASYWIATLREAEVVILMTKSLEDLTRGELMQMDGCFDLEAYDRKSYCKTASLIDHSLAATAVLADPTNIAYKEAARCYGSNLGVAFQIVDDCLDITGSEGQMGKPKLADMAEGIATLPILLAAQKDPKVDAAVRRRFVQEGDIAISTEAMERYGCVAEALMIADQRCRAAVEGLSKLHKSDARDALEEAVQVVLTRKM